MGALVGVGPQLPGRTVTLMNGNVWGKRFLVNASGGRFSVTWTSAGNRAEFDGK